MGDGDCPAQPAARVRTVSAAKTAGDRFALTLAQALNDMGAQGWEYVRAETLPSEERSGLTSRSTVWHNVLVFRRALGAQAAPADATPAPIDTDAAPSLAPAGPAAAAGPFSQPMRAGPRQTAAAAED